MGIYTWFIYVSDGITPVLELAEKFPQSAFVILCSPNEITDSLLDESNQLYNLMYALEYTDGVEEACMLLRARGFLYSVYYPYKETDADKILNGDLFSDTEILHPVFTILFAYPTCPFHVQTTVYQYIQQTREEQNYRTLAYDLIYDNHFIDGIISDESISIGFNPDGNCISRMHQFAEENYSFFDYPLAEILKKVSQKKHNISV